MKKEEAPTITFTEFEQLCEQKKIPLYRSVKGEVREAFVRLVYQHMCIRVSPMDVLPERGGDGKPDFRNVARLTPQVWRDYYVEALESIKPKKK